MSYCGTCGGFYSPDCPHRAGNGQTGSLCSPAVNPYELQIVEAYARIASANLLLAAEAAMEANRATSAASLLATANKLMHLFDGEPPDVGS